MFTVIRFNVEMLEETPALPVWNCGLSLEQELIQFCSFFNKQIPVDTESSQIYLCMKTML